MTIFDSIKYPITDSMSTSEILDIIPSSHPIMAFFIQQYHRLPVRSFKQDKKRLRDIILKYNTDECLIQKYYREKRARKHKQIVDLLK